MNEAIVEITGLKNYLGGTWVHDGVDMQVKKGEIVAIIGGSGTGKTTILRSLLILQKPTAGSVKVFGEDVWQCTMAKEQALRQKMGMLFQKSALFSSMSVLENVMFPLKKYTHLSSSFIEELALLKLLFVGLTAKDANKMPSQLSGGMQKRAAAARALSLDPELLLLDEPLSGLDPKSGYDFDELLLFFRKQLGLTIIMVSHDIASLKRVADNIVFLGEGHVLASGNYASLIHNPHPLVQTYFKTH